MFASISCSIWMFNYRRVCDVVFSVISPRSSEGLTPLHVAALWGCYQNLKLLLMNGGNPNNKDNVKNVFCIVSNFP